MLALFYQKKTSKKGLVKRCQELSKEEESKEVLKKRSDNMFLNNVEMFLNMKSKAWLSKKKLF